MNEILLTATSISKQYGSLQVLKSVDIHVKKEEVLTITGPSGAGKSTLLHIIGTLDNPDSGQVSIHGQDISKLNRTQLAKFRNSQLGFVFQFHNLLPEFSAIENVSLPGLIGGGDQKPVFDKAAELLGLLGLEHRLNHKPSELSGGEQQRVAVARSLINDPQIIFADEPSGNLDSANAKALHELFFELRDELKKTFVIVTHNDELAKMSDRSIIIMDGLISSSV